MRVAAAGIVAIIAALAIELTPPVRADEGSPFPSPAPTSTEAPGSGGYAVFNLGSLSASGGNIVSADPAASPLPFGTASASGYSVELLGRLSSKYVSTLRFEDVNIHGAASSVETRFDVGVLYQFARSQTAAGIGFASLQRSTISAASNGIGAGIALLPDFSRRLSPYGSFFYYPSLTALNAQRGGLAVIRLGVNFAPPRATGVFARAGLTAQHFGASSFSPASLTGVEIGVGTTF